MAIGCRHDTQIGVVTKGLAAVLALSTMVVPNSSLALETDEFDVPEDIVKRWGARMEKDVWSRKKKGK